MKREDLKKLGLEDEAIESVMKLHGQTVNGLQEQVTALQASEANLKSQNEKHEKDLKTLQKDNGDNETLKQTIKDLQKQNADAKAGYEEQLVGMQRDSAIEKALATSGAKNTKAVKALLDADKIVFKDGELSGLAEQLEAYKQSDPYMFDMGKKPEGYEPAGGSPAKTYSSMEEAIKADDLESFLAQDKESED
ncbi:phage scaffolding protein [Aerococcus urinaeequi]|uniref:phage scaffolding protein n=1 Tax=Aerococcus urinaeequi TaxID=51665 RepID=UPI002281242E|nr:phage scaffolding protein [Aerococcus urinaeequi]MCY7730801.1 phage scaffolding protein [Aerococcus urinaeequi]